jgi:hypothetical protein
MDPTMLADELIPRSVYFSLQHDMTATVLAISGPDRALEV